MGTLCEDNIVQSNNKRKHRDDELKREAIEICDNIISQVKQRFKFIGHLVASNFFWLIILRNMMSIFQKVISMKQ